MDKTITLKSKESKGIASEVHASPILKSILGGAPFGFNLWDKHMVNIMCNEHIIEAFHIENGEEFLERFFEFSPEMQPNGISSQEMARINFEKVLTQGKHDFYWMHITPSGKRLPCKIRLIKLESSSGEEYVAGYIKDLRADFSYGKIDSDYDYYFADKLPKSVLMNEMSELSDEGFFSVDLRTGSFQYYGKLWFNESSNSEIVPQDKVVDMKFLHEDDIPVYADMINNIKEGELKSCDIRILASENNYRYHRITCKLILNDSGTPVFLLGKGIDIHEHRIIEERSQKDLLTDCYNKISAENIISEKLASDTTGKHALFIIDIDNFKAINDNLGHYFGDEVLRDISAGLKEAFREVDIVARIGGDEFIIFVEHLTDMEIIKEKAEKILEVYRKTYSGEYKDYSISGSVGIALYPRDGATYEELYQNADKALNHAKMQGKNRYMVYSADFNIGTTRSTTKIENANRIASSFFDYDLISAVFNILYEKNGDNDAINLTLSYLCQKYNADRSYIFETLDGGVTLSNTFEYCKEGIRSEIDNLQNFPYEIFADFLDKAHNNIIYSNDLRETLEHDRTFEIMDDQGILSFVHAQVKREDKMTFFIGLDDCTKTRIWTEREINSLQYIGKLLSIILQGTHMREAINELAISNRNSADILDNSDSIVYVSDLDTYELLYLNGNGKRATGIVSDEDLKGKICYKVLQGKEEPCDFCTNHLLNEEKYYEWSYYNPTLDTTFLLKDKLTRFNGKLARLEIATDVSKLVELERTLKERLADEQFLMNCVEMLHSGNEANFSIYSLLETVANYYEAERSYIFELSECGRFISNTYEFCRSGYPAYKDSLQNLPVEKLGYFLNRCEAEDAFCLRIEETDENSFEYELMKSQNLTDITIGAIRVDEKEVTGFVGVDNSRKNEVKTSIIRTVAKFVASFIDETELVTKLNQLSYYDTLTGIKNRHSYNLALKEINKNIDSLGVLYVDIIGLSTINDSKGVMFGDCTLVKLSEILDSIFKDKVFRVGGDEFVVLAENIAEQSFEKDIDLLKETLAKEEEFHTTIGYTWNQNLNHSDGSLGDLDEGETYGRILLENLEMEIASGKYVVHMQPQINLSTGKVEGAEALVRRVGANDMLQSPTFFLPFYEKEGIISKIDEFVLETVCKTLKSWKDRGVNLPTTISVNCSRMTVSQKGVVERFSEICDNYGVEHSRIMIEITETINGIGESVLAKIIKNFSDAGFLVSLDDFGSGYSNLNSLVMSDFDEIKIDMTIIDGIHKDKKSETLARVAITLCEGLEYVTSVAEGVECKEQHDKLCELGCKTGQGYYYSKPISITEFEVKYGQ